MADSRYNFSLTTFDKTGRLGQIDHALKAVENGDTSLGVCGERIVKERRPRQGDPGPPIAAAAHRYGLLRCLP